MGTPGIAVNFFAALIGAVLNILLVQLKTNYGFEGFEYQSTFILLIVLMVIRHHCRVVFIDSTTASHIPHGYIKRSLRILILLVIIGSGIVIYFTFGMAVGAMVASFYSLLFMFFWVNLLIGSRKIQSNLSEDEERSLRKRFRIATFGGIVDVIIFLWWANWTYLVITQGQSELVKESFFFFSIILICIVVEIAIVYRDPVVERWIILKQHLT